MPSHTHAHCVIPLYKKKSTFPSICGDVTVNVLDAPHTGVYVCSVFWDCLWICWHLLACCVSLVYMKRFIIYNLLPPRDVCVHLNYHLGQWIYWHNIIFSFLFPYILLMLKNDMIKWCRNCQVVFDLGYLTQLLHSKWHTWGYWKITVMIYLRLIFHFYLKKRWIWNYNNFHYIYFFIFIF